MSNSGFQDKAKLAAALELARSFKSTKDKRSRDTSLSSSLGRSPAPAPGPRRPIRLFAPGNFGVQAQPISQVPVIGTSGIDFLKRRDQPAKDEPAKDQPAKVEASSDKEGRDISALAVKLQYLSFGENRHQNTEGGTVLDNFFSLADQANSPPSPPEEAKDSEKLPDKADDLLHFDPMSIQQPSCDEDLIQFDPMPAQPPNGRPDALPESETNQRPDRDNAPRFAETKLRPHASVFVPRSASSTARDTWLIDEVSDLLEQGQTSDAPHYVPYTTPHIPASSLPAAAGASCPWPDPSTAPSSLPIAYAVMVPFLADPSFFAPTPFQTQPPMALPEALPTADGPVQAPPTQPMKVRKPAGGLKTSMWAA
ncbi:hypothetical protein CDD83_5493 [Cordyceps sp. RAO-2017]|nr:hypothetical protein CDD83_5493 [Cordyceps sp. RAO-2017]